MTDQSNEFLAQVLDGKTGIQLPYCLANGSHVQILDEGVIEFQPRIASDRQLDLVVSCGIHGNETAPVELVNQIVNEVLAGEHRLRARVLFIFGNVEAMRRGERYVDDDMNRLFCRQYQNADDSVEARRAAMLEMHVMRFFARHGDDGSVPRLHYDLHTAIRGSVFEKFAIYPYPHEQAFKATEISRLGAAGVSTVLLQSRPSPTFSYFTSRYCRADAFTLELGKARPFGQNQAVNLDALGQVLRSLLCGEISTGEFVPEAHQLFRVSREIIKHSDKFRLHLEDKVENFTPMEVGFLAAEDGEVLYRIDEEGARIVFPNPKVKNGLRAGIVVVPTRL